MKRVLDRRRADGASGRKAQAVCVALRDYIRKHYREGDALMPIRQLTKALGASITTVGGALRQLHLAGLLEVNHGERTRVTALALKTRVGILTSANLAHPNASEYGRHLVCALLEALQGAGFEVALYCGLNAPWACTTENVPWNFLNDARCGTVDAVVVTGNHGTAGLGLCESLGIPVIGILEDYPAFVSFDGPGMVRSGIRALLEAGCRRVAMIAWDAGMAAMAKEALRRKGLATVPEWFRTQVHPLIPDAGYRLLGEVWDAHGEKPDGLLIADDAYAPGVARAIRERGIAVPAKLKVAALGNKGLGFDWPFPVTVLENDPVKQARNLVEVLQVRLGMREGSVKRILKCSTNKEPKR